MLRNIFLLLFIWAFEVILSSHGTVRRYSRTRIVTPAPDTHKSMYHIYLTFDDGPSAGSRLVDSICRADSVDVNVFLVGMNASINNAHQSMLERYRSNPFVELANHSYTHAARRYRQFFAHPDLVLEDFKRNQDSLRLPNRLCRLPGRNVFRVSGKGRDEHRAEQPAADLLTGNGFSIYGWDIEWRIKPAPGIERHTPGEMFALIEKMLSADKTWSDGRIVILVHDQELTAASFANDVGAFVRLARADGRFSFEHLSAYQ